MKVFGDGAGTRFHIAYVRLLVRIQGSGHADGNEIDVPDETEVSSGRQHPILDKGDKIPVHDIADVVVACVDHVDLFLLDIESDGSETGLRLLNGKR